MTPKCEKMMVNTRFSGMNIFIGYTLMCVFLFMDRIVLVLSSQDWVKRQVVVDRYKGAFR